MCNVYECKHGMNRTTMPTPTTMRLMRWSTVHHYYVLYNSTVVSRVSAQACFAERNMASAHQPDRPLVLKTSLFLYVSIPAVH